MRTGAAVPEQVLRTINETMYERGPDSAGYYFDNHFAMAMRRLSIIDLAGGYQPISNEDGTVHVVLNGEIYNYIELRAELITRGHIFKTHSDVEVLVHLYEEYGLKAIDRLNGMFAFSLWDSARKRLWLGRDRLGIKPLVYYHDHKMFAFGSTIDTITSIPGIKKDIDEESFLLYMMMAYVPAPRTIYKNIFKLPAGHWALYENEKLTLQQYWSVESHIKHKSEPDFVENMRLLFEDSIKLHSRSDVPVGTFLSGGVDSSAVTAYFSRIAEYPVHTFSIDFENKGESEAVYAEAVAKQYRTIHHSHLLNSSDVLSTLLELLPKMDEPNADSAIIPSYLLSKYAHAEGLKVILTGAGGDELFGGYNRHYRQGMKDKMVGRMPFLPKAMWNLLGRINPLYVHYGAKLSNSTLSYALSTVGTNAGVMCSLLKKPAQYSLGTSLVLDKFSEFRGLQKEVGFSYAAMITDTKNYLVDNILSLQDKTTMAASIEGRVPLLDHRMVELAFSVLPEVNVHHNYDQPKRSLKNMLQNDLPKSVLQRSKMGFNAPMSNWLAGGFKKQIMDKIYHTNNPIIHQFFNVSQIKSIANSKNFALYSDALFALYVFDLWSESH